MKSFSGTAIVPALVFASLSAPLNAQMYNFDPAAQANKTVNVYFGSTKDADGMLLSGVLVELQVDTLTYVMVTDDAGRFKIEVPKDVLPQQVIFRCSKPGYAQVRATKRTPPGKAASPIQADCILDHRGSIH